MVYSRVAFGAQGCTAVCPWGRIIYYRLAGNDTHLPERVSLRRPAELRRLLLLCAPDGVLHKHPQRGVLTLHLNGVDLNDITQPLLQRALHEKLRRRSELVAL